MGVRYNIRAFIVGLELTTRILLQGEDLFQNQIAFLKNYGFNLLIIGFGYPFFVTLSVTQSHHFLSSIKFNCSNRV